MPIRSKNDNLEGPAPLSAPGGTLKKEQLMAILREVSEGSRSLEEAASALTASELHEANRVYATVDLDRQQSPQPLRDADTANEPGVVPLQVSSQLLMLSVRVKKKQRLTQSIA